MTTILHPDTTVYGHGTASHTFGQVNDVGVTTQVTENTPTIILNRPAIGTATTERFSVGIKTTVTAFLLVQLQVLMHIIRNLCYSHWYRSR